MRSEWGWEEGDKPSNRLRAGVKSVKLLMERFDGAPLQEDSKTPMDLPGQPRETVMGGGDTHTVCAVFFFLTQLEQKGFLPV